MILALVGLLEMHKPLNPWLYRNLPPEARQVAPAFVHVGEETDREWYIVGYYPTEKVESWGRDTIEVRTSDGHTYRAIEQFATTEDNRIVRLCGPVSNGDLYRRPLRHGQAVTLLVAFRERFSVKGTQVRLSQPPSTPARVETAGEAR